jgi:hypothetical protein
MRLAGCLVAAGVDERRLTAEVFGRGEQPLRTNAG